MERRTLGELQTLYSLEPELRDIYVEGPFARAVLDLFFRDRDRQKTNIYDIDAIEVPAEVLLAYDLTPGARSRLIALAKELGATLPVGSMQAGPAGEQPAKE